MNKQLDTKRIGYEPLKSNLYNFKFNQADICTNTSEICIISRELLFRNRKHVRDKERDKMG